MHRFHFIGNESNLYLLNWLFEISDNVHILTKMGVNSTSEAINDLEYSNVYANT